MLFVIIFISILFLKFVESQDKKRMERNSKAIEEAQEKFYEWVDENMNPIAAREMKAYTETFIQESVGWDYKPTELEQVSTAKERKARAKAYKSGKTYTHKLSDDDIFEISLKYSVEDDADLLEPYVSHTQEEIAQNYCKRFGYTFEEAMEIVDNTQRNLKIGKYAEN